nr:MAG TPA: hypothetical protein [Caudoviricetes sp.]
MSCVCTQKKQSAGGSIHFAFILKAKTCPLHADTDKVLPRPPAWTGGRASRGETVVKNSKKWGW